MEKKAVCTLAVVPMRCEPSDKSEMINQIIFGETMDITNENEKWFFCRLHHDDYTGWVDKRQVRITEKTPDQKNIQSVSALLITTSSGHPEWIPGGAFLNDEKLMVKSAPVISKTGSSITEKALLFLHAPYLWGGRSVLGIDCSGFTQIVFRMCGLFLPRDAYQQVTQGVLIPFVQESETGDLAFFDDSEGKIIHVGIILKNPENALLSIIHSSGCVRIDALDHHGIFNTENQQYSHALRTVRRLI